MIRIYKILTLLVIWLLIHSILPFSTTGKADRQILYVDDDGTKDFHSIQDAIENASDKDIIYVYNGSYNEVISINKPIYLIGESKENTMIIGGKGPIIKSGRYYYANNPEKSSSLIDIKTDNVTIENFKIKNSTFFDLIKFQWYFSSRAYYPPIYIFEHTNIGIGINVSSSNCKIVNNIIELNGADGINLNKNKKNFIMNNTIKNNGLCGIYLKNCSKSYISNNTIANNGLGISFSNHSYDNILYHNNFLKNSRKHILKDENNTFYNEELGEGNYWDNYNGTDDNHDGIGDRPYDLPSEKNKDKYPLMYPYHGELIKNLHINREILIQILVIGVGLSIIFLLPIAYYWRKKYFK